MHHRVSFLKLFVSESVGYPQKVLKIAKKYFDPAIYYSEWNWVWKSFFQSDLRFYDCLITRWLETTSILVGIERIYRYQFKSNYLKNHRPFAAFFFCIFGIYMEFTMFFKKNKPHSQVFLKLLNRIDGLI